VELEDKPAPGGGYLLFLHGVLGGSLLLDIAVTWHIGGSEPVALFAVGHSVVIVGLFYWGLLHAAYNTRYAINGDKLDIRCGIFKSSLRLSTVRDVEKVRTMSRTIGWGFGTRGFCNRFRNGVALIARQEKVFLSPSNPDIFMEQIRSRLSEPEIELSPPCRSGQ
jgi:hypothetical protein